MQCYTPHIRYYQKVDRATKTAIENSGKQLVQQFIPRTEVFKRLKKNENYITWCKNRNKELEASGSPWRYQTIPCRNCYACSLNYSAIWATRMACEALGSKQNYFITVTYNDSFLPIPEVVYYGEDENAYFENDGTWITGSLDKKEAQDFRKRLRRHLEYENKLGNFKFFMAGEYGSLERPHYHAILMDCRLDESQFYDCHLDKNHHDVWKSHELDLLWSVKLSKNEKPSDYPEEEIIYDKYGKPRHLKGFVQVAEASWQDMAYVARYTAKKAYKTSDPWEYYSRGKIPEFVTMSKNIGDEYFKANLDEIYRNDEMIAKTVKNKTSAIKPPKRADILLESINPEKYDEIKSKREQISLMIDSMVRKNDNYTDLEKLKIQEDKITTKAKMLKREL